MRGQRILLLEDGLRLNNARRRVDSGEPTSLVWASALERVEVVRGPASVLYGSDAVGGVVNLVTRRASEAMGRPMTGFVTAGHRSAGRAGTLSGEVAGSLGGLAYRVAGGYRDVDAYRAPRGTFGDLVLERGVEVHDSDVRDRSLRAEISHRIRGSHEAFARHEAYRSEDSGFGWIDPEVFGPLTAKTRLLWPEQDFARTVLGVRSRELGWMLADRLDVSAYTQSNERWFTTEVHVPLPAPPGATVDVMSENFTDLNTRGVRLEARKLAGDGLLVTYGLDAYQDRSQGTDTSTTTRTGFGPAPLVSGRGGPAIPDARLRNVGVFAQGELDLGSTDLVVGVRYQDVRASTLATAGHEAQPETHGDRTLVGAISALHRVSERVNLVASVARGFRSPNLIERFFVGPAPSGGGFWEAADDLSPETSLNLELGARFRGGRVSAEAFVFRNLLTDGIVLEPTGREEGRTIYYRNVNVDKLRYRGFEIAGTIALGRGVSLGADWTVTDAEDRNDPDRVLADTYPSRLGASVRLDDPEGRFWLRYAVRRSGERDALEGTTPVGDVVPAFAVHDARAGIRAFGRHHLGLAVENVTDALYAEALNTGFFRPEPGRSLAVTWSVEF